MNCRSNKSTVGLLALLVAMAAAGTSGAGPVAMQGFDLFVTDPMNTSFMGVNFQGVPLVTFDFGLPIGVKNTNATDTIVHRMADANAPMQTIPIELVALQLRSVNQTSVFGPLDYYFVTLQSRRSVGEGGPGQTSSGNLTINFNAEPPLVTDQHGTFDTSSYNAFFDVRKQSLTGTIVFSGSVNLDSTGNQWAHEPGSFALEIVGVNDQLNGMDDTADFHAIELIHSGPHGADPRLTNTPEPSTLALLGLGTIGLLGYTWRCRKRAA